MRIGGKARILKINVVVVRIDKGKGLGVGLGLGDGIGDRGSQFKWCPG